MIAPPVKPCNRSAASRQRWNRRPRTSARTIVTATPFDNAESLTAHQQRFRELESMIEADRDAYEEARRAVRGAEAELEKSQRLVRQAARDEIPDSPKTKRCMASIAALERETKVVAAHLGVAHGNWQEVDAEAARINAGFGSAVG